MGGLLTRRQDNESLCAVASNALPSSRYLAFHVDEMSAYRTVGTGTAILGNHFFENRELDSLIPD
jgi:hypothetical protein